MTSDLPTKYRPSAWDQVLGQPATVSSLRRLVKSRAKHAFLFTGDSGLGKTTLARIAAKELGTGPNDLLEIDAATNTGIDAWRALRSTLHYAPMGAAGATRSIIVDEAHRLSKQAWDSLLKDVEEPPSHLYWLICTTEPTKVPPTIRSRCASFALRPVSGDLIFGLLDRICTAENYDASDKLLDMITQQARGSPRQALAFLETCWDKDEEEASELLQAVADERKPTELAFGLLNRTLTWPQAVTIVGSLQDKLPAESLRRMMVAIMSGALLKRKKPAEAEPVLAILDKLSTPLPSDAKAAEILLLVGRLLIG